MAGIKSSGEYAPVLRDVRRANKIFSYTGRGAFFFIFEKEWGAHSLHWAPVQKSGLYLLPFGIRSVTRISSSVSSRSSHAFTPAERIRRSWRSREFKNSRTSLII